MASTQQISTGNRAEPRRFTSDGERLSGEIRGPWETDRHGRYYNHIVVAGKPSVFVHSDRIYVPHFDHESLTSLSPSHIEAVTFIMIDNSVSKHGGVMAADVRFLNRQSLPAGATAPGVADPLRESGTVTRWNGTWGQVVADDDSAKLYIHAKQSNPRVFVKEGLRVSFIRKTNVDPKYAAQMVACEVCSERVQTASSAVQHAVPQSCGDRRADFGSALRR